MKFHRRLVVAVVVLLFIVACSTPTPQVIEKVVEKTVEVEVERVVEKEVIIEATEEPLPEPIDAESGNPIAGGISGHVLPAVAPRPNRLIIKNADMQLLVEDTDNAIDRVTQVVGDTGGYIISSRVWYEEWLGENYKYASITIGIPVDRFETAMRRFRDLAITVTDERAGGQDVTDEYVDLDSRLGNLEATRDRIREFLDQAQDVEESLRVNEQLAAVESEIEAVKGRMNYLFDRSSYSTITMELNPQLPPKPVPPTPTPTPTATPMPAWNASAIASDATKTLTGILQVLAEMFIWFSIVILPLLLPLFGAALLTRYLVRKFADEK